MTTADDLRRRIANLPDPELPVLTLEDLGILRDVELSDGFAVITLTPTYSGCPAIDPIRDDVERAAYDSGCERVEVRMQLSPAWTTDWMSDAGRRKLAEYGIAPPARGAVARCAALTAPPRCPRCGSRDTREVSRFGATPCQAQHVCNACLEPFDRFKAI